MNKFYLKIVAFRKKLRNVLDDCLALTGAGAVSYGVYQIYVPAGWIAVGIFLIVAAVIWSRGTAGEFHDIE